MTQLQTKMEVIRLEELRIKEENKELLEAEREKELLETKKRQKEELKDKAPVLQDINSVLVDPAPVIAVDTPKPKTDEGLSTKDIEVIEDALEKLGKINI